MKFAWLVFLNINIKVIAWSLDWQNMLYVKLLNYHSSESLKHAGILPRKEEELDDEYAAFWEEQ